MTGGGSGCVEYLRGIKKALVPQRCVRERPGLHLILRVGGGGNLASVHLI
jgi:hypothetical protein